MKVKRSGKILCFGLLLLYITLSLSACSYWDAFLFFFFHIVPSSNSTTSSNNSSDKGPIDVYAMVTNPVAYQARQMQEHLTGYLANTYDEKEPMWQAAISFWMTKQRCVDQVPIGEAVREELCSEAISGSLQCVEFVTAAFGLADDPLPTWGHGKAFWDLYKNKAGWTEMDKDAYIDKRYNTSNSDILPHLGDMIAFGGGPFGHIAIVVDVKLPNDNHDGYIEIAQANAPGTLHTGINSGKAGNFARLTWNKDGSFAKPTFLLSEEYLQGFIRHVNAKPRVQQFDDQLRSYGITNITANNRTWMYLAIIEAARFKLQPKYFVRQLNQESGFNPNARSSEGAIGIAQFLQGTADGIPKCILNKNEKDPLNCEKNDSSKGIDPTKPEEAIPAAAYYVAKNYEHYQQKCIASQPCPVDSDMAQARALAAYNAGRGATDSALDRCGSSWLLCMDQNQADHQTRNYIAIIMGCDVVTASGAVCLKT